jgi:hypothetical protein
MKMTVTVTKTNSLYLPREECDYPQWEVLY